MKKRYVKYFDLFIKYRKMYKLEYSKSEYITSHFKKHTHTKIQCKSLDLDGPNSKWKIFCKCVYK